MAITLRIYSDPTSTQAGAKQIGPAAIVGANNVSQIDQITLASGANTITVPTNATGVVIEFPDTNTQTVTLKGVTGDTGIALTRVGTLVLQFHTTPAANFVITMGGAMTAGTFATFNWF